jgi:exodeoxyribonuclease-3
VTQVEYEDFILLNIYFPNGWTRADGTEMLTYKLWFYDDLATYVNWLAKPTIIVGDFNICHQVIDIARPDANKNSIWFLPIERQRIGDFMQECQMKDMFRHLNPEQTDAYTRWSYRWGARIRNVGRRLDYAMVHDSLLDRVASFRHMPEVMGSDHCPIELVMK